MDIFFAERVRHPKKNGIGYMGSALEMRSTILFLETVASLVNMRARASHMLASTHTGSMYFFYVKSHIKYYHVSKLLETYLLKNITHLKQAMQ
jgi:hypothetical protein